MVRFGKTTPFSPSRPAPARSWSAREECRASELPTVRLRYRCQKLFLAWSYDFFVAFIILLNAASIGAKRSLQLQGGRDTSHFETFEHIFLVFFGAELCLRLWALGPRLALQSTWVILDVLTFMIIEENFSTIPTTMLTLVQFITFDDIGSIYFPFIKREPVFAVFFLGLIMIVGIVLMNLITAVIVEGAIESKQDQDAVEQKALVEDRTKKLLPKLRGLFEMLDADGSGDITRDEWISGMQADPRIEAELCEVLGPNVDPIEILEMLDVDGGGVEIDELCEQVYNAVRRPGSPLELPAILKLVRRLCDSAGDTKNTLERVAEAVVPEEDGNSSPGARARRFCTVPESTGTLTQKNSVALSSSASTTFSSGEDGGERANRYEKMMLDAERMIKTQSEMISDAGRIIDEQKKMIEDQRKQIDLLYSWCNHRNGAVGAGARNQPFASQAPQARQ